MFCRRQGDTSYRCAAEESEEVVLEARSDAFDTVSHVWLVPDEVLVNDNFEAGSTNSRISFTVDEAGT